MGYPRCRIGVPRFAILAALVVSCLSFTSSSVWAAYATLAWTCPGDNGGSTRVSQYDLRISTKAIAGTDTVSWWNAATKINLTGKVPGLPGTTDKVMMSGLVNGMRYYAVLQSADAAGNWSTYSNVASFLAATAITAVNDGSAPAFVLGVPRPTPTSGRTEVSFELPGTVPVEAAIYNAQGRLIRMLERATLAAGSHLLHWDGTLDGGGNASSGVYWIRVAAGSLNQRVKVVVAR